MTHTKHHEEPALAFLATFHGEHCLDMAAVRAMRVPHDYMREMAKQELAFSIGKMLVDALGKTEIRDGQQIFSIRAAIFLDTEEADRMPSAVTLTPITYTHEKS